MKKVLAFLLTAMLAVTAFSTVAFAASPSPEKGEGVITEATGKDADGNDVELIIEDATGDTSAFKEKAGKDTIVDHKVIKAKNGTPKFPVAVDLKVTGSKATDKGYILLKKADGSIVKLDATFSEGTVKASFPELGEFVLVTAAKESSEGDKSPVTSDNLTTMVLTLLAASAFVGFVSVKKIRTAA